MRTPEFSRRSLLRWTASGLLTSVASSSSASTSQSAENQAAAALAAREKGRLGFCIRDTGSGVEWGRRLDERFAMCSTFKLPLVAAVLQRVDQGRLSLQHVLRYSRADLVPHAPVLSEHLASGGLTIAALCQAAQVHSDNVAANLLLRLLDGPAGFTAIVRSWGDATTRLDRTEPRMNIVLPGESLDTTTPRAMARTATRILCSDLLSAASRSLLAGWMLDTATGNKRIRAGLPKTWRAGDKTGTGLGHGMTNKYNDVAITWPPGRAPLIITAYYDTASIADKMQDSDQALLAEVGRLAARWIPAVH